MLGSKLLSAGADAPVTDLGPLASLPGVWVGSGLSVIPRPDQHGDQPTRLELNQTRETLTFTHLQASLPPQGSPTEGNHLVGVHYLHQIEDAVTGELLHGETGIWLTVAASAQAPGSEPTVVRFACVPQSEPLLAAGTAAVQSGGRLAFPTEDITPLYADTRQPVTDPRQLPPYLSCDVTAPAPPASGITVEDVRNPNRLLQAAIQEQNLLRCTALTVDTACESPAQHDELGALDGGTTLANPGNPLSMRATSWIEEIEHALRPGTFLQLQYSQRVLVRLNGIDWPHLCVATLRKI